jgi:hypothetical protein
MNEVTKLTLPSISLKRPSAKESNELIPNKANSFENQLEVTVKKLESMNAEIDVMMQNQNSTIQNTNAVSSSVSNVGNYIKNMAGIVENFSGDAKTQDSANDKSSKFVAAQYEKNSNGKA